jgi:4-amino-4-deoxy-L-arabinose transferase-like glycosyltransferase
MTLSVDEADRQGEARVDEAATETTAPAKERMSSRHRTVLILIIAVAFILRLAWLLYAKGKPPTGVIPSGDQYSYWYYGNEIAKGHGYVSYVTHLPTANYPIGYPAILAALFWVTWHTPFTNDLMLSAGLMHVVFSTATVLMVYVIGRHVFNPTVGLLAAALMAIFPDAIYEVATLQLETTFVFLAMAALAIIVSHDWSNGLPSRNRLLAFGAVLGLSILVRPFSVWFLIGLFLAVLATHAGWKRAFSLTLVATLAVVAVQVPWIIRNEIRMHAFLLTSTNTGDTLCLDRNSTAFGGFRFADHDGCVNPNLPEVQRNEENTKKAISWVVHNPGRELVEIGRRAKWEFIHDHDGIEAVDTLGGGPVLRPHVRSALSSAADWYFYFILSVSVAGLPLLFHGPNGPERRLVLVAAIALLMIPLLLWGNPRFNVPLQPFIAVLAAAVAYTFTTTVVAIRSARAVRLGAGEPT